MPGDPGLVRLIWVSSHYDVHLEGLCGWGRRLCWFKIVDPEQEGPLAYDLWKLTVQEALSQRVRKKLFEVMVGYHWSYPERLSRGFYYKWPQWLWTRVFKLYYRLPAWGGRMPPDRPRDAVFIRDGAVGRIVQ